MWYDAWFSRVVRTGLFSMLESTGLLDQSPTPVCIITDEFNRDNIRRLWQKHSQTSWNVSGIANEAMQMILIRTTKGSCATNKIWSRIWQGLRMPGFTYSHGQRLFYTNDDLFFWFVSLSLLRCCLTGAHYVALDGLELAITSGCPETQRFTCLLPPHLS